MIVSFLDIIIAMYILVGVLIAAYVIDVMWQSRKYRKINGKRK